MRQGLDSYWKRFTPLAPVAVLGIALWLLFHELTKFNWHEIEASLLSISSAKIGVALCLVASNFVVLIGYDWLALKVIGVQLEFAKVAFASFTGFVASYNFGATLGCIPVRYRVYSAYGLSTVQIVQLSMMLGITFWIGEFALAGVAFVLAPISIPPKLHLPFETVYGLGWILLSAVAVYVAGVAYFRKPMHIFGKEIQLPNLLMTCGQLAVAAADFLIASGVLFILLPSEINANYFQFLSVFLLATIAVVLSHVPGGVGVFELVILTMLGLDADKEVVAALVAFRVIYYIVPLIIAGLMVGVFEYRLRRDRINPVLSQIGKAVSAIAPMMIAGIVLIAGAVLLLSGATPSIGTRVRGLHHWVPLPFIEVSHFLGSIAGAALLIVARGLYRKLDSAWWIATFLIATGIFTSLIKGFDYEEAILLGFVFVVLLFSRKQFYRKGYLLHQRFSASWISAIALVVICSIWLGTFAFKHVEYQHELWWEFSFRSDAPRFLRASVGVVAFLLCFMTWKLSKQSSKVVDMAMDDAMLDAVECIVHASKRTNANLSLLGDKRFLFNSDNSGFVMYAIENRSWISMGDPVGSDKSISDLVWKFRELCDEYDGWPVFYQVDKEHLSVYLEQGLTLLKIGEEACVPIQDFSIEGQHKSLRANRNKLAKSGLSFEIVDRENFPNIMPRLRSISDAWMSEKRASEKGFSLGFFSEEYLKRYPCAVVKSGETIIAFANIWQAVGKSELSIDLMRYDSNGPNGLMDFLFTELLLWGKEEGFQWFNMGMAPLSGIETRPLAPLWNRALGFAYRHGDHFYSFEGLRQYKQKFDPVWQPKYLASPGGLALPRILTDLTRLIGRKRVK
jgi:phosphatidylglycerol lysyltransferase